MTDLSQSLVAALNELASLKAEGVSLERLGEPLNAEGSWICRLRYEANNKLWWYADKEASPAEAILGAIKRYREGRRT